MATASAKTLYKHGYKLYSFVNVDGDKSFKGCITAVTFRSIGEPLYEVSYMAQGVAHAAWIQEPRLQPFKE